MVVLPLNKRMFRGRFGERLHDDSVLVVVVFTASDQLRSQSQLIADGFKHVSDCGKCNGIIRDNIKFY